MTFHIHVFHVVAALEPFGTDESYRTFLLRMFDEGEEGENGEDELGPVFHVAAAMEPFGMDESYRTSLLRMFDEGEGENGEEELGPVFHVAAAMEPFGMDESYRTSLLRMFDEGEGENGEDGLGPVDQQEDDEEDAVAPEIEEVPSEDSLSMLEIEAGGTEINNDHPDRQGRIEDFDTLARPQLNKWASIYALTASLTTLSLAYVQALMIGLPIYIKTDLKVGDLHLQVVTAFLGVVTLLGLVLGTYMSNRVGRRWTIVAAAALFFIGPLIMGLAPNYAIFLLGRGVANFGASFAVTIVPIYATEISPAFSRGTLISIPEVCISVGTLLGNTSNFVLSKVTAKKVWPWMLIGGAVPAGSVALAFTFHCMPESPEWLVMRGRLDLAKPILTRTCKSEDEAALRLAEMKKAAGIADEDVNTDQNLGGWLDIFHPVLHMLECVLHMLVCAVVIQLVQQTCSIDTMMLFAPRFYEKVGINTSFRRYLVTLIVDLLKVLSVLFATVCLVDRLGRRRLLLGSICGVVISLVSFGAFLRFIEASSGRPFWAVVMCFVTGIGYVTSYSIGLGPIAAVYCSEIFPTRLRAQGYAIGVGVKQTVNIILSLTYLSMSKEMTLGGTVLFFASIALVGGLVLYRLMPETSGKNEEEIELLFGTFKNFKEKSHPKMHQLLTS
ncbi:hypothetical protein BT93_H2236 [Corymbia citriodora subsp. variegata]|nr:hypothetical protein BT93_H2236 [Corymbia citriodora subsp. variegata]